MVYVPLLHSGLWAPVFSVIVALYYLYGLLGGAAFAGFGLLSLLGPVMMFMSKKMKVVSRAVMERRDKRGRLTAEAVGAIRLVKVYCWEDTVSANIKAARDWELKKLVLKQYMSGIATFFGYIGPVLATGVAFGVYSYGTLCSPRARAGMCIPHLVPTV